mgnify:CR=1 FL=1
MMLTSALENIGIGDAAIVAVLGYSVVFFGLILLMGVIIGFVMPSLSAYTYKIQNGLNLYNMGFASFDFTVATKRISNGLTFEKGGLLFLDYNTEIQGVAMQTSRFRFDISVI